MIITVTEYNNLWTRVRELEAELAAARRSLRDEFAMHSGLGLDDVYDYMSGRGLPCFTHHVWDEWAKMKYEHADAMMIERDKR